MDDDAHLLQRWIETSNSGDFAGIVRRHQGMVYSAALRCCRNAVLAEEAAHLAFVALARKAKAVTAGSSVGGWLYRAAVMESANLRRREARNVAMKERFEQMRLPGAQACGDPWPRASQHLDAAMLSLRSRDRDALVMRFFEERSFREVGKTLGISEEAARKRITRSLQRLALFLARRTAVPLTVSGLSVILTGSSSSAAPPSLLISLRDASLHCASPGLSSLLFMTKKQASVCCILLTVALLPLAFQWQRLRGQDDEIRRLQGLLAHSVQIPSAAGEDSGHSRRVALSLNSPGAETGPGALKVQLTSPAETSTAQDAVSQEASRAKIRQQIDAAYRDLYDLLGLDRKQQEAVTNILSIRSGVRSEHGRRFLTEAGLDDAERKSLAELMNRATQDADSQLQAVLSPENFEALHTFEISRQERSFMQSLSNALKDAGLDLAPEVEASLTTALFRERKEAGFVLDLGQGDRIDYTNYSPASPGLYFEQNRELRARSASTAAQFLTPGQLDVYQRVQARQEQMDRVSEQLAGRMLQSGQTVK